MAVHFSHSGTIPTSTHGTVRSSCCVHCDSVGIVVGGGENGFFSLRESRKGRENTRRRLPRIMFYSHYYGEQQPATTAAATAANNNTFSLSSNHATTSKCPVRWSESKLRPWPEGRRRWKWKWWGKLRRGGMFVSAYADSALGTSNRM